MAINSFKIIGIKAFYPKWNEFFDNSPKHYEKVEAIQKVLYQTNKWFYFYEGITIAENNTQVEMTSEAKKDFSLYDTDNLKISLCAIVGKNGAGKSSIVELLVRTINNLAATMLGEGYNFSAAEHLHFIDNVFADLCFQIGNTVYILEAHGRHITLNYYKASRQNYFDYKPFKHYCLLNQNEAEDSLIPLKKHKEGRRILKTLFYTMLKMLQSVRFANVRGVNVMMITHSPFVLSDIPESNVLCLGEGDNIVTKTLGGNIMEMLSDSFFMKSSIGDFIKNEIALIVDLYNRVVREKHPNIPELKEEYKSNRMARVMIYGGTLRIRIKNSWMSEMLTPETLAETHNRIGT